MKFKKSYVSDSPASNLDNEYHTDYPKEPIGGDNPYWMCSYCNVSDPQINGKVSNHRTWCTYRLQKEQVM